MRKIKLNVKAKDSRLQNQKAPPRKTPFSAKFKDDSIKTQTITNNYYSVQNGGDVNYPDFSDDFRRDARRYSYSLEVQL